MTKSLIDLSFTKVRRFVVIFYIVATLGFIVPLLRPFFIFLTPFALLLNFVLLYLFKETKWKVVEYLVWGIVYFISMVIEIVGVKTGKIFGTYHYGDALGLKMLGVPFLIGLNWLFLCYATISLFSKTNIEKKYIVVLSSLLMVLYDMVLEQVAPKLDMWHWQGNAVPIQNYLSWFVLALILNTIILATKTETVNKISKTILVSQFVSFVAIAIYFYVFEG